MLLLMCKVFFFKKNPSAVYAALKNVKSESQVVILQREETEVRPHSSPTAADSREAPGTDSVTAKTLFNPGFYLYN